jgi:hypothetical protein
MIVRWPSLSLTISGVLIDSIMFFEFYDIFLLIAFRLYTKNTCLLHDEQFDFSIYSIVKKINFTFRLISCFHFKRPNMFISNNLFFWYLGILKDSGSVREASVGSAFRSFHNWVSSLSNIGASWQLEAQIKFHGWIIQMHLTGIWVFLEAKKVSKIWLEVSSGLIETKIKIINIRIKCDIIHSSKRK